MVDVTKELSQRISVKSSLIRSAFAEFLGTFVLIVFGDGSVAQSVLSRKNNGEFLSINVSWGMAVMLGVMCSVNVSGGHINPAVSLAMTLLGRLSIKRLFTYMLSQYLGAFFGAVIVYLVYYDALNAYDNGVRVTDPANMSATAGIFATYPQTFLRPGIGLIDQIVGTGMLVLCICAITDSRNSDMPKFLIPLSAGLTVLVIGAAYGFNCGYAINPARDLSPRIFTAMAGWGVEPFSYNNYNWFWVPVIGPHVGAIIGAYIYILLIEVHWSKAPQPEVKDHENATIINDDETQDATLLDLNGN